jgi:capsular exopolysaccharide synthesis family protein
VTIQDFLRALWRRKLLVLFILMIQIGFAIVGLRLVTPLYESTSTLSLTPRNEEGSSLIFFGALEGIVPVYTDAAESHRTRELAEAKFPGDLPSLSIDTFEETPLIKLKVRDPDPDVARDAVDAYSRALLQREADEEFGFRSLKLDQIDEPIAATSPVYPNTRLTLAVAGLLGLAFGAAAAFLRESYTTKVETSETLSRLAGVPCFGEIPSEPAVRRIKGVEELATNTRLRGVAEAFRDLRTNLLFAKENLGSLLITSPEGSHGKTTVALGLAVTLARSQARTLLVDGDLRKGRLADALGMQRAPGLAECLVGAAVEDVIQGTSVDTLDVVTSGGVIGDPGELLLAEFAGVLERFEEMYEIVIIDSPPTSPVNDSRIMARFTGGTLIVASADSATRRTVRAAVQRLSLIGVRPTAAVLNHAPIPGGRDYYGYLEPSKPKKPRRQQRRRERRAAGWWPLRRTG